MTRAERLARDLNRDSLTGAARALADEAILIVERLEQLDRTLQGDADIWIGIAEKIPGSPELVINAPLAEARQQATAMRGLLAELVKVMGMEKSAGQTGTTDELGARRDAARQAAGL